MILKFSMLFMVVVTMKIYWKDMKAIIAIQVMIAIQAMIAMDYLKIMKIMKMLLMTQILNSFRNQYRNRSQDHRSNAILRKIQKDQLLHHE